MKVVFPKALWVFALGALVLVVVAVVNYLLFFQGTNTSVGSVLFPTILAATLFYVCSASLAFFESSVLQRFLVMGGAVLVFLGVPALLTGSDTGDFFAGVLFSFIFGINGLAAIVVAAVSARLALGAARVDVPEEDELILGPQAP